MKPHEITILEEASRCLLCYDPPCSKACPSASGPASFIQAIRLDDARGGAQQETEANPLGSVCAAACTAERYCEGACIRGKIDRPVDIRLLHTYIARKAAAAGFSPARGEGAGRFAVLGANMAGLAAAAELAKAGGEVAVYADGPVFGAATLAKLAGESEKDDILQDARETLDALGVRIVEAREAAASLTAQALQGLDAVVVSTRAGLARLAALDAVKNTVYTGELAAGPDDAAFSVKKGRAAAARALAKEERA